MESVKKKIYLSVEDAFKLACLIRDAITKQGFVPFKNTGDAADHFGKKLGIELTESSIRTALKAIGRPLSDLVGHRLVVGLGVYDKHEFRIAALEQRVADLEAKLSANSTSAP